MKELLAGALLLLPWAGWAQSDSLQLNADGQAEFVQVIQVPGSTVEQLYTRARSWVVVTFSDANAALKVQDKENGTLMGKGIGRLTWWDGIGLKEGNLNFTFQIDCKEGRYRLVMNGLEAVPDPK